MNDISNFFFELIRLSIGTQESLSRRPSDKEWKALFEMAKKQSLVGICFAGVQRLAEDDRPLGMLYLQWMGLAAKIQQRNEVMNQRCVELQERLSKDGLKSCILKGQSLAPYYDDLARLRQSGDIDVWVPVKVETLVDYVESMRWRYHATTAHVGCNMFPDTEVELHPQPAQLRCPWNNRKLQMWFNEHREVNTEFNLVFMMVHMYHHGVFEGLGLRQVMDYYFVLKSRNSNHDDDTAKAYDNDNVFRIIESLGILKFAQGIMNIMQTVFGLDEKYLLCEPDPEIGAFLLSEMMIGGNFGKYDTRDTYVKSDNAIQRVLGGVIRNNRYYALGPWEVICTPIWRLWHYFWMRKRGYRSSQQKKDTN